TGKTPAIRTLTARVSAAGKVSLSFGGKSVKSLPAGVYRVTVNDRSRKVGLVFWTPVKHRLTLSRAGASGKSSENVHLTAGTWSFGATGGARKSRFVVT
ncbi:MAG TPA: hypothetical protein VG265_03315, partial [Gaiellaceae bacterium]|nr:hypothetical protein [Gaiellaceae bacterium]